MIDFQYNVQLNNFCSTLLPKTLLRNAQRVKRAMIQLSPGQVTDETCQYMTDEMIETTSSVCYSLLNRFIIKCVEFVVMRFNVNFIVGLAPTR